MSSEPHKNNELWGHPKGLYVLFLTEMWERFSYYGMRSLLVYYMIKHLLMPQEQASHIYGLYTGFVYFTPFFGGLIADRYLGQSRSVIVGGMLMALGHFMMIWEGLFIPALVSLIFGSGFFKPNISTQVGNLYMPRDSRRDSAFSIFYVGINLGALFSPLVCGTLGEIYGWHYGFAAAGFGMIVSIFVYLFGQRLLPRDSFHNRFQLIENAAQESPTSDRRRITVLVVIGLITVAFWAAYEQQGNTMALWADSYTDRHVFNWEFPASWFQSLNPAFIFILTPLLTMFWKWQSRINHEPDSIMKMVIGCFLLGCGFFVMMLPAQIIAHASGPVSVSWLILFTFIVTVGELYLSPIGLSLVTKLAPSRLISTMMGVWLSASFAGNYFAGFIGGFWDKVSKDFFFFFIGAIAICAGICLLIIRRYTQLKT